MLFDRAPHLRGSVLLLRGLCRDSVGYCNCFSWNNFEVYWNSCMSVQKRATLSLTNRIALRFFQCKYFQNSWHIKTAMLDYNQYMSCHTALLRGLFGKGLASHWGETLVLFSFPLIALFTAWGTYMSAQVFHQMNGNLDTGQAQS